MIPDHIRKKASMLINSYELAVSQDDVNLVISEIIQFLYDLSDERLE